MDEITATSSPPPLPDLPLSEIYERTIREVEAGWRKRDLGAWDRPTGKVCLVGAAMRVCDQATPELTAGMLVGQAFAVRERQALQLTQPLVPLANEGWPPPEDWEGTWSVTGFNDHHGRTQQDVVALLEKGRAWAEEQGQ